jgi:hypothetical protein
MLSRASDQRPEQEGQADRFGSVTVRTTRPPMYRHVGE